MGQSSDELRQEIDMRRHDAERKINDLQQTVQGTADDLKSQARDTVDEVRGQVQGTVDQVRGQVQSTVEDTMRTVTENVDIERFVQERPLVSLGAALIGGFVLGGLIGDGDDSSSSRAHGSTGETGGVSTHSGSGGSSLGHSVRKMIRETGLEDTFSNAAAAMMGSFTEQLKQTMDRNMPGFATKMDQAKYTEGSVMDKTRNVQP